MILVPCPRCQTDYPYDSADGRAIQSGEGLCLACQAPPREPRMVEKIARLWRRP
jgi:hypothetical protein